jgi:hypothetical protein
MMELYFHSPICLHGTVLNSLSTGTTLSLCRKLLWDNDNENSTQSAFIAYQTKLSGDIEHTGRLAFYKNLLI